MVASDKTRVVFVSKRNSLRSVLAQACLEHLAGSRFAVQSCGWPGHVAERFHPAALGALASASMKPPRGQPKSWNTLRESGAARARFLITLDEESSGALPAWPGQPDTALWLLPDIAASTDAETVAHGAIQLLYRLQRRLELFINLPMIAGDRDSLRLDVRDLGSMR